MKILCFLCVESPSCLVPPKPRGFNRLAKVASFGKSFAVSPRSIPASNQVHFNHNRSQSNRATKALAFAALLVCGTGPLWAGELSGPWVAIMQENDLVVRTDRHYTQGLKIGYLARERAPEDAGWLARWTDCLPPLGVKPEAYRGGLSLGQTIYTPTDITTRALQQADRPYAGLLQVSLLLQRRGQTASETPVLDHLQLDLGVIGPPSLAEQAQNTVHRLRNFGLAMGWDNQLKTEPTLGLKLQRTWRYGCGNPDGFAAEFLPHAGASVGNSVTFAALGGQLRAGYRLPRDFGTTTIDSILPGSGGRSAGAHRGFYLFTEVEGRAIAYNAFLDGGLFHDGHHVGKHPGVGDAKLGFVFVLKRWDISYTQIARTKEFAGQKEIDAFGSLALRFKW